MTKNMQADGTQVAARANGVEPLAIMLTDPRLDDNPITYVNDAFQSLTLYSREYALGRNWRFLQGPETDRSDVQAMADGLRDEREFEIEITNHRADGTAFRNRLTVAPIRSPEGELTGYLGVMRVVNEEPTAPDDDSLALLRELQHRVKNHLAMVVSMIRVQARREVTPDSLRAISRRIEALGLLYEELLSTDGSGGQRITTGAYLSRIASVVSRLQPRGGVRVNVECDEIRLPLDRAARLGLLLSEFLTNSLEHAFKGRDSGSVEVRFFRNADGRVCLSVADDGVGLPEGSDWPFGSPSIERQRDRAEHDAGQLDTTGHGREAGVGGSIVAALATSLLASLDVRSSGEGTIVTLELEPDEPSDGSR